MTSRAVSFSLESVARDLWKLLGREEQGLRDRCQQRFTLLLLLKCCIDLSANEDFTQEEWVDELRKTIPETEEHNAMAYNTAKIIVEAFENASWSMKKEDFGTPAHCFTSIKTITGHIKTVVSLINNDFAHAERSGYNIADFETDEMLTEDSAEEEIKPEKETRMPKKRGRKPRVAANGTPASGTSNVGGRSRKWEKPELLHLLRVLRDNIEKTWDERVRLHNESYVVPEGVKEKEMRTKEGVRQRLQAEIGLTIEGLKERVEAKVAELEDEE